MNRLCHGTVVLVACVTALSCGDPTGDLRGNPERLSADPASLFIDQGATQQITVRAVDAQGNELAAPVTNIAVSPAGLVDVSIDSTYLAGTDTVAPGVIQSTRTRISVVGVARAAGTITVTAAGLTLDIPVRVLPVGTAFDATFSNQAPALGELVTLTAPAGFSFTDSSAITVTVGPAPIVTGAAGGTLTFLPGPNTAGKATVTNVVPSYAPALSLDFTTVDTIGTPIIDSLNAAFSTRTPTSGQQVTITAPAGFTFQPTAAVSVAGTAAFVNSRAVDGSTITFQVVPGSTGPVAVDSTFVTALPQFPLSLTASGGDLVAGPVTVIAGTATTATAPTFNAPAAPGLGIGIFNTAAFPGADITGDGGVGAQYYKINLAAPATLNFTIASDNGVPDLDGVLCSDAACTAPDFALASVAHNEGGAVALPAGITYLAVVNFDGGVAGSVTVTITQ
ncbi:MAG: hypothetical protein ABI785_04895 [Gemmatimonadales bacterium]